MGIRQFRPGEPLLPGRAHSSCRAVVTVPARNEENSLAATLDALAAQVDSTGAPLRAEMFEIVLLLNNCTDKSASIARKWKRANRATHLHVIDLDLPVARAHIGTARRLLMDTAWHRLAYSSHPVVAILTTDSDTLVAPDWITRNLRALERGADAVGGSIRLKQDDLHILPAGARLAYQRDRRYQSLVARLEDLLDPQPGDRWPRHLEHFGASLACTALAYMRAGGMPAVKVLEDVSFVDALRRVNARLRHDPTVVVYTSSRLEGRVQKGLSSQLRIWQQMSLAQEEHRVLSASWLAYRFRTLRLLRQLHAQRELSNISFYSKRWRDRILSTRKKDLSVAQFLTEIDCDKLIRDTYKGQREGHISRVNNNLAQIISRIQFGAEKG